MDAFLGELRIFPFNFAPKGWAACNGQLLSIQQNAALFSILGIVYGGNGTTNFALPDLQGRVPLHFGAGIAQGAKSGSNGTTLTAANMPQHTHSLLGTSAPATADIPNPGQAANNILGVTSDFEFTPRGSNTLVAMAVNSIGITGGSTPLSNMQPYLGLNICIAITGYYPSRD
jgi:microcystin-dependent protein